MLPNSFETSAMARSAPECDASDSSRRHAWLPNSSEALGRVFQFHVGCRPRFEAWVRIQHFADLSILQHADLSSSNLLKSACKEPPNGFKQAPQHFRSLPSNSQAIPTPSYSQAHKSS